MDKDYKKLYKEALERARESYRRSIEQGWTCDKEIYEQIFPELNESKDEINQRIKKEVIEMLRYYHSKSPCFIPPQFSLEETLAWLEKQGEQKSVVKIEPIKEGLTDFQRCVSCLIASVMNKEYDYTQGFVEWAAQTLLGYAKHEFEKQGELKTIEQDTETRDLWEYIREFREKFGRLPKDADELAACIYYVMKRQKPVEWSKEDEKKIEMINNAIDFASNQNLPRRIINDGDKYMLKDWLKSFKPNNWKPSDEQIKSLRIALQTMPYSKDKENVLVILEELEKL